MSRARARNHPVLARLMTVAMSVAATVAVSVTMSVAVLAVGGGTAAAAGGAPTSLTPARFLDTRPDGETLDGQDAGWGPIEPGVPYWLQIGGRGDVPTDAAAVFVNLTAVGPAADGHLTAYPCDGDVPLASNVNYGAGRTTPNAALVKLSDDGAICIASHARTDAVVDVTGFVTPTDTPIAVEPARLADTRPGGSTVDDDGARTGLVQPGTPLVVEIGGRAGVPDATSAAFLNVTAVGPLAAGHLTVYPCGGAVPNASNVNYLAGGTVAGAAFTKLDADGRACVATHAATHVVVDVAGHVPEGDGPTGFAPERILDTRADGETIDGDHVATGRVGAGDVYVLPVAGRGSVPIGAATVIANLTAVGPGADGHLTAYPCDAAVPNASNVNYVAGVTAANSALVRLSVDGDGAVCIRTHADVDLVVDVSAYVEGFGLNEDAQPEPQLIAGVSGAVDVAVGTDFACAALASGEARCWGEGFNGSLGNGSQDPATGEDPATVIGLSEITAIDAGRRAACAVSGGSVHCWGDWPGAGALAYDSDVPVEVPGLADPVDVRVGGEHACALMAGGTVRCWGDNFFQALNGSTVPELSDAPVTVPGVLDAIAISVSALSTCALLSDGAVECWGAYEGRSAVSPSGSTAVIGSNYAGHCLLRADMVSGCWRADRDDTGWDDAPDVVIPRSRAGSTELLAAGSLHACLLTFGGHVECVGDNVDGSAGHPTALWVDEPHRIGGLADVAGLDGDFLAYCAVDGDGAVHCWGQDYFVLGNLPG